MNAVLILGTRPQIIKSAPFISLASKNKHVNLTVIHTGQHYDYEMTKLFFEELQLPDPKTNLNVGSGTHAKQTAEIMIRLEEILKKRKPDLAVVPGDTNSTLAGALTAAKMNIPVAHIEAGARSYDVSMPEEVNRRLTDHCSSVLLTATENCADNLQKEGIAKDKIWQTGDTMYDVLMQQLPKADKTAIMEKLSIEPKNYVLLTLHRPENVDNGQILENVVRALVRLKPLTIVFPVHPRTKKQLRKANLYGKIRRQRHIKLIEPIGYHEMIKLMKNAKLVLTDSGGMQKESFWLKTPCITLRENTEWIETVQLGANYLIGTATQRIVDTTKTILENEREIAKKMRTMPNPFGNGKASEEILRVIKAYLNA